MTPGFNQSTVAAPVATEAERLPEPLIEVAGPYTYIGDAQLGVGENQPGWRIRRRNTVGGVTRTEYANGSLSFDQPWSQRAALTYSR